MLAAVLHDFNDFRLEEVPMPDPGPGQVRVRIVDCGFCQTDYKAIVGLRRNVTFPLIPGHEPSGVIDKLGPGVVGDFQVGDAVICQPSGYCGQCEYCRVGLTHYCKYAYTTGGDGPDDVRPGAFAEYMVTGQECLFHKPANLSFEAAALTEPLSGAWKGVVQKSEIRVGEDVVVIGTGGIGLLCLMVAKAAGAGHLVAIDASEYARQNALKIGGATKVIDALAPNVKEQVYAEMPNGPDLVIEAAGSIAAVKTMVDLRRRGTRWNVFGITTHEKFELDGGQTHFLEGRMDASFGTTPLAMQQAIRLMERNLVDPAKIVSHRFALKDIYEAVKVMGQRDRNKVIIHVTEP
ncbi:MAG: alcohol dehydrogenase catalytic domain-containing protein [Victivallales bacterium]|nr:alcohol dehydrogenase catalytic domain-containing protein [Victivallales bacterium]